MKDLMIDLYVCRDPFANPNAPSPPPPSKEEEEEAVTNLFESDNPPKRGDYVQIIWPSNTNLDPSTTYDDEFPNGLCLVDGVLYQLLIYHCVLCCVWNGSHLGGRERWNG